MPHAYKPIFSYDFPLNNRVLSPEASYWNDFKTPISLQENTLIQHLDLYPFTPYKLAISVGAKISVYDLTNDRPIINFTNFKKSSYGASFRKDGELIISGCDDSSVKLFSFSTKSQLKEFVGHTNQVHVTKFSNDNYHVISGSNDKSLKYWDIATGTLISSYFQHQDYIKCGTEFNELSSNCFITGSYDHTAKIFDFRTDGSLGKSVLSFDHGAPIEDILLMPNNKILFTAGGNFIKAWDMLQQREMHAFTPHLKTITSLALGGIQQNCLLSASLDKQIKMHDIATFDTLHSISCSESILTMSLSPKDQILCIGMVNGLLSIFHRRNPDESAKKLRSQKRLDSSGKIPKLSSSRYFNKNIDENVMPTKDDIDEDLTTFEDNNILALEENVIIPKPGKAQFTKFDKLLRKFNFNDAFNSVFVKHDKNMRYPHITVSFLRELIRQNKLKTVFHGRWALAFAPSINANNPFQDYNEKLSEEETAENRRIIDNFIEFLLKFLQDPRFNGILIEVAAVFVQTINEINPGSINGTGEEEKIKFLNQLDTVLDADIAVANEALQTQGTLAHLLDQIITNNNTEDSKDLVTAKQYSRLTVFDNFFKFNNNLVTTNTDEINT